jgi:hypothetical protein
VDTLVDLAQLAPQPTDKATMTSLSSSRIVLALLANVALAAAACGTFGGDAPATPGADTQGTDGGSTDGPKAPPVNGPASNNELTDALGIFVSTKGQDSADGTHAYPLATIQAGIDHAKAVGKRVYVCAGTYKEALVVADSISVIGGLDCSNNEWRTASGASRLEAPASPAARAKDIKSATRLEGLEIIAPSATTPSGSSIGVYVSNAMSLTFANVRIRAGAGGPGVDGTEGLLNAGTETTAEAAAPEGVSSACPFVPNCGGSGYDWHGGAGGTNKCKFGSAGGPGGAGGDGRFYVACNDKSAASRDPRGRPLVGTAITAAGGSEYCQAPPGTGLSGAAGADGKLGKHGTWSFTREGFVSGNGTAGTDGAPGQGGGGGGGTSVMHYTGLCGGDTCDPAGPKYNWSATGGGGGAGGCAGLAGSAGSGGGASIAAFVVDSRVTFTGSRLESDTGGRAGKGTLGTDGLPGSLGGASATMAGGGGVGGKGGAGGISGHGAPGPSIALAYSGTRPTVEGTALLPGQGGAGQPELRKQGGALVLPAVAQGDAKAEHAF